MADKRSKSTRIQITLKGGAQIEVDVKDFSYTTQKMSWTTPDDAERSLLTCDVDEIVAIVKIR